MNTEHSPALKEQAAATSAPSPEELLRRRAAYADVLRREMAGRPPSPLRFGRMAPDGTIIPDRPPVDPENLTEEELRVLDYGTLCRSLWLPRPIRDKADYAAALAAIEPLWGHEADMNLDQADWFELVADLIAHYEAGTEKTANRCR